MSRTSPKSCGQYARRIDALSDGAAAAHASAWNELRSHLRDCAACQDRYNRTMLAVRLVDHGPNSLGTPASAELAMIEGAVLDEATTQSWTWTGFPGRVRELLAPSPSWMMGWATVAAATTLGLLVFVGPIGNRDFQSRGTGTTTAAPGSAAPQGSVRALCLTATDSAAGTVAGTIKETARCGVGDQLKFLVTNRGHRYLFLVGVDQAGGVLWYEPHPPATTSIAIAEGVDLPIGGAIRVGVNHEPGAHRVFALFSSDPIDASAVDRAITTAGAGQPGHKTIDLTNLGVPGISVERMLKLEITP